jgi:hypothetical protein
MAKYLQLPDGNSLKVPDNMSYEEAMSLAQTKFPDLFSTAPKQDTSGLKAAASAGASRLKGQAALTAAKLGVMDVAEAEKYQKEKEAEAAARFTPTEKGWTEDFGLKFRETLGGSLPSMVAPAAAGLAALALPVSAPVALGAGLLGAGAVSTGQFTGSNLAAQMGTGKSLAETSGAAALGAAVPQALIDTAAMALLPGVGKLFGSVGSKLTTEQAKAIASQTLGKAAMDYTAKTGMAMGREGITEVAQQTLERLQAGLNIADPEARKEYIDSFIGGAVLGGTLAPAGRYMERSGAQTQAAKAEREERSVLAQQAAEQQRAAKQEEEALRQTPDHALRVGQEYDTLLAEFQARKAALKTPGKDATPVEKAEYADAQKALKETNAQLKDIVPEYRRTAPIRKQAQEQARVDALSPEEFMLEQTVGGEGMQAAGRARGERGALFGREQLPAAPVDTSVQDYATERVELAREQLAAPTGAEYLDYLMQDPAMAAKVAETKAALPGLNPTDAGLLRGDLKKTLAKQAAEREKAAVTATKTELQQRQTDLQAQKTTPDTDPLAMLRESEAEVEQQRAEGETNFDYLDDMFGQAFENQAAAIAAPEGLRPTPAAPTIKRTVEKLIADRDQAEQDRVAANLAGERAAARAAAERAEQAKTALNRVSKEVGDTAPYAAAIVNNRNAQEKALFDLEDVLDKIKRGAVLGGAATEEATTTRAALQAQADAAKKTYIRAVLAEAAAHRRAQGTPAVGTDEAVKAASEMDTALEELIVRMQAAPRRESLQEVITKPAQVRGTEVVSEAETEMRDMRPLEERRFGAPAEAVKVIQEQLASIREALSNARGEARKIEAEPLTRQYASTEAKKVAEAKGETATTVGGELRRRTEYVRDLMGKPARSVLIPRVRELLNRAADVMDEGRATRDLLDAVENVASRLADGRRVNQTDAREINDALAAINKQAREGERVGRVEGQGELFTERQDRNREDETLGVVRQSFTNLMKSPPVMKGRAAIEQAKKAVADAKARAEAEQKKKGVQQVRRLAEMEDAVEAQRQDLQRAINNAMDAERGALSAAAKMQDAPVVAAQKSLESAKKDLDALQAKIDAAPEFAEKLQYANDLIAQRKALDDAQTTLDSEIAQSQATYDGAVLVAAAHRDSMVQFERKALEKFEKRLEKLRGEAGVEVASVQREAAEQRARVAKAENDARLAAESAGREKRKLEQRLLSGLGLEGVKRVGGETAAIKSDTDKAVDAERKKARDNLEQAMETLGRKQDVPQLARVTSPVTRDVTKPGRLEESRKPKQTNVAITQSEMQQANRISEEARLANEDAARIRNMSEKERKAQEKEEKALAKELAKIKRSVFRVSTVRGKGTTPERLQAIIKQMTADWKNVPTIVMAETYDALPDNIKAQAKADDVEGFIPGVYDPESNVVYLVAENLPTDADIYATVAHEVAGHFGLRGMLGGDYTKVMDDIYAGNPAVREQADAKMKRLQSLTKQTATEEVLADMAEQAPTPATRSALGKIVKTIKDWFNKTFRGVKMSDEAVMQIVANARTYVIEGTGGRGGAAPTAAPAYRSKETAPANAIEALSRDIVAQPKTLKQKLGDSVALQAEMQAVDMRAGLREVLKAGAAEMGDDTKFTQAMYNVLKADQKMPVAYTVMSMGPLELYKDAKGFYGVRSTNKHSAKDVFDAIADMPGTDTQSKIDVATTYMIAQRAANKGLSKLDLGELGVTQEKLDAAMAAVEADPALEKSLEAVRRAYNAYNKGQISFLAASGAIPKQVAEKLLAGGDYVPYYRVRDNGMAELNFGNNVMVSIGDIRRQPYLASLKGGETKILPLNESLPLNTFLLTDMALTNMATKNVAYALQAMGKKSDVMQIHSGTGPADPGVIRFKQEPDPNNEKDTGERWLKVETKGTAAEGVPAELLVQSLEGSHLALPEFLKLGGVAADLLRSGVTRTPLYIARQLIRDPMAAAFTGGLNYNAFTAVLKAGKEFVRMNRGTSDAQMKLLEKGLVQSGIFAGDTSDMKKMALQIASGKDQSVLDKVFAAADRAALRADAATRSLVYENAEANGLSDVEADMMTMESMNFYKRGLSPTLQYASRLIPFFNAQIQGLNVLFKAARGNMPFEEQQQIKRKFFNNAMLLVATGLVYAMAMEDDETFRNARPRDKYTNFFLPIPGLDEPIKLPIPFEAGYFYSLAVAAVDGMRAETDSKEQWKALKDMFLNSIPGYSSMGIPQIVKPAFEVWTNKNFMSGSDIESRRFQGMDTEERYNANTTELAKAMSKALPILSPIQIEHMVRGYLGVLPLAAAGAANGLFAREGKGEAPEKRLSELPVLGPAFQKKYGGGDKDVAYEMAEKAMTAKTTLNKLVAEGRREDAVAYRDENRARLAVASAAGQYRQLVGRINADLRRTQERSDLTAAEKRVRIDNLEKAADEAAKRFTQRVRQVQDQ